MNQKEKNEWRNAAKGRFEAALAAADFDLARDIISDSLEEGFESTARDMAALLQDIEEEI